MSHVLARGLLVLGPAALDTLAIDEHASHSLWFARSVRRGPRMLVCPESHLDCLGAAIVGV